MPAEPISIQGYARTVDAMCDALGVECVSVVGNSMGGFIGAELALSFGTRVDRLVLVSAAGLSTEYVARTPSLAMARVLAAGCPARDALRVARSCAGRGCGGPRCSGWSAIRRSSRCRSPQELVLSFGKPGFVPALKALLDYSYRERLRRDRDPGPDRLGAQRPARAGRRRRRATSA